MVTQLGEAGRGLLWGATAAYELVTQEEETYQPVSPSIAPCVQMNHGRHETHSSRRFKSNKGNEYKWKKGSDVGMQELDFVCVDSWRRVGEHKRHLLVRR